MNSAGSRVRVVLAGFGTLLFLLGSPASGTGGPPPETPPNVTFVLLRLDRLTHEVWNAYRFSQPWRKILQPEGTSAVADLFLDFKSPNDFGYTELRSRLTGQVAFRATAVWSGKGRMEWPSQAEEIAFARGAVSPETDLFGWFNLYTSMNESEARLVWESVRDLEPVASIAAQGPYGVVVFDHLFSVPWWRDIPSSVPPEIEVLVYSRPTAPRDACVLRLEWPRNVVTSWVRTVPEVSVHNFSDEPIAFDVETRILSAGRVIHESTRGVTDLPADASATLSFDPFFPRCAGHLAFQARLRRANGGAWTDAFPDNDAVEMPTILTSLPVFRPVSSFRHPGPVPPGGQMLDFDGDGDLDVIRHGFAPRFLQNDGTGRFTDISARVPASVHTHSRSAIAADLTGDGLRDVLLVYFEKYPILLQGDGTGGFQEITQQAGLTGYTSTVGLDALDLEGDGDQDLILRRTGAPGTAIVLLNDGYGHFIDGRGGSGFEDVTASTQRITVGDIDGDALPDLVMANWGVFSAVYRNQGGGSFQRMEVLGSENYSRMAALIDYDGDGLLDILLARNYGNRLFRQGQGFTFEDVTSQAGDILSSFWADVADIDEDGRPDLLLDLQPVLNVGGSFESHPELLVDLGEHLSGTGSSGRILDIDGDGDLDIYSAVVFENQGLPGTPVSVRLDPRPGQTRNAVAASARGLITVALFGSEELDVRDIDPASLVFGPGCAGLDPSASLRQVDLDRDGMIDLIGKFRLDEAGLASGGPAACLEGATRGGVRFRGCGNVGVVGLHP